MITIKEIFSLITALIGIIFVLFLTYYLTKWFSVRTSNIFKSKYINIVDKIVLGQNKCLAIVEISGKYYLLSITDSSINIIKELEEFEPTSAENTDSLSSNLDFNKILSRFIKK